MLQTFCQTLTSRWKKARAMHRDYARFYIALLLILLFAVGVAVGIRLGQFHYGGEATRSDIFVEAAGIIMAEAVSIILTVLVVNKWYERQQVTDLKHQLVREVGSGSNEFAKNAVSRLRAEGWLEGEDGLLKGKVLNGANLKGADLSKANLRDTKLVSADLQESNLYQADLSDSSLYGANLRQAWLQGTNLSRTNLKSTDLRDSKMRYLPIQQSVEQGRDPLEAGPKRANLNGANLEGAYLEGATLPDLDNLLYVRTWPDGEEYHEPGLLEKLKKFTDSEHPAFAPTLETINSLRKYQRVASVPETFAAHDNHNET